MPTRLDLCAWPGLSKISSLPLDILTWTRFGSTVHFDDRVPINQRKSLNMSKKLMNIAAKGKEKLFALLKKDRHRAGSPDETVPMFDMLKSTPQELSVTRGHHHPSSTTKTKTGTYAISVPKPSIFRGVPVDKNFMAGMSHKVDRDHRRSRSKDDLDIPRGRPIEQRYTTTYLEDYNHRHSASKSSQGGFQSQRIERDQQTALRHRDDQGKYLSWSNAREHDAHRSSIMSESSANGKGMVPHSGHKHSSRYEYQVQTAQRVILTPSRTPASIRVRPKIIDLDEKAAAASPSVIVSLLDREIPKISFVSLTPIVVNISNVSFASRIAELRAKRRTIAENLLVNTDCDEGFAAWTRRTVVGPCFSSSPSPPI
jgi:hypothetical protein